MYIICKKKIELIEIFAIEYNNSSIFSYIAFDSVNNVSDILVDLDRKNHKSIKAIIKSELNSKYLLIIIVHNINTDE